MRNETKSGLVIWLQYFLIALVAELGASMALFPNQPGSEINLYGYFQKRVQPHLYLWFIIFMLISAVKLAVEVISKRRNKKASEFQASP